MKFVKNIKLFSFYFWLLSKFKIMCSSDVEEQFANKCLELHNKYRDLHGVPRLRLNEKLNDIAKGWAEILAKRNSLAHRTPNAYGENLYMACGASLSAEDVVNRWYSENSLYDFQEGISSPETENFTQVIWQSTREMGIGFAQGCCQIIVVANYYPPGNLECQYLDNVPPLVCQAITPQKCIPQSVENDSNDSTAETQEFQNQFLEILNEYRSQHNSPALIISEDLNDKAKEWAKTCSQRGELSCGNQDYGESMFYAVAKTVTPKELLEEWYKGSETYDYDAAVFQADSGNFTQMVWKSTTEVGLGVEINDMHTWIVAFYNPPGNIVDQFSENVLRNSQDSRNAKCGVSLLSIQQIKRPVKAENNNIQSFIQACLLIHNKYRSLHGCPPLKITEQLNKYAGEWAQHLANRNSVDYRSDSDYGENLFYASGNNGISPVTPVKAWYDQIASYNFNKPEYKESTAHFTQLIWKDTREVGIGVAKRDSKYWVVANYYPAGNELGSFNSNVPPLITQLHAPTDEDLNDFANGILEAHNNLRALHKNTEPLTLNPKMNSVAQAWAQTISKKCQLESSVCCNYGENLFCIAHKAVTPEDIVKTWYDEVDKYDFSVSMFSPETAHFTQVVWKNTKEIGVGFAQKDDITYAVVQYNPPGNFDKLFKENVFPTIASSQQLALQNDKEKELQEEDSAECKMPVEKMPMDNVNANERRQDEIKRKLIEDNLKLLEETEAIRRREMLNFKEKTKEKECEDRHKLECRKLKFKEELRKLEEEEKNMRRIREELKRKEELDEAIRQEEFALCLLNEKEKLLKIQCEKAEEPQRGDDNNVGCKNEDASTVKSECEVEPNGVDENNVGCKKQEYDASADKGECECEVYSFLAPYIKDCELVDPMNCEKSAKDRNSSQPKGKGISFQELCQKSVFPMDRSETQNKSVCGSLNKETSGESKDLSHIIDNYFFETEGEETEETKDNNMSQYAEDCNPAESLSQKPKHEACTNEKLALDDRCCCRKETSQKTEWLGQSGVSSRKCVEDFPPDECPNNSTERNAFQRKCLSVHNKYRVIHGCSPYVLSESLNTYAQQWAEYLADNDVLMHREDTPYGENIYSGLSKANSIEEAVCKWYTDVDNYSFAEPFLSFRVKHFTQIVWKNSKRIGVGVAKRGDKTWIVVNYEPRGNTKELLKDNVRPMNMPEKSV